MAVISLKTDKVGNGLDASLAKLHAVHEVLIRLLRELAAQAAEVYDEVTVGMAGGRLSWPEKTAWMLRSSQVQ